MIKLCIRVADKLENLSTKGVEPEYTINPSKVLEFVNGDQIDQNVRNQIEWYSANESQPRIKEFYYEIFVEIGMLNRMLTCCVTGGSVKELEFTSPKFIKSFVFEVVDHE